MIEARTRSWVRAALMVWAAWTGVALLFMLYVMLPSPAAGDLGEWGRATAWQLVSWWCWALGTPAVVLVTRRAMGIGSPLRLLPVHLAAGVAVSGLCALLQGALQWMVFGGVRERHDILSASSLPLADQWSLNLVVYAMVVGVLYVVRAGRLESQLARARLDALSARLRPHFLFNTLNTISGLVLEDPKAANRMITQLSELLRQAFDRGDEAEVTLEEELRLLQHYVAIQQQRFGDRVQVTFQTDLAAEGALVPPLLLQPLVENAVAHGPPGRPGNGGAVTVQVEVSVTGNRLRLAVRDDGPGFRTERQREDGVGLAGTRARLVELYGSDQRLELTDAAAGGAVVTIEIPWRIRAGADR